jgi:hypothetical protein
MAFRELAHHGGFVGRQIIQDDMNLLVPGAQRDNFLQEGDKVVAGVTSGCPSSHPRSTARTSGNHLCIKSLHRDSMGHLGFT